MDEENAKAEVTPKKTAKKASAKSSAKTTKTTTKSTTKNTKKSTNNVKSTKTPTKSSKTTKTATKSPAKKTTSKTKKVEEKKPVEKEVIKEEVVTPVIEETVLDKKIEEPKVEEVKTEVKEDQTFKMASKQPAQTNSKNKNKKEVKHNHGFLKFIFIVFAIIAFIYVGVVIHNATLMREIMDKTANVNNIKNYHFLITNYEGNKTNGTTEILRKDNISKIIIKNEKSEVVMWKNSDTNEGLMIFPNDKKVAREDASEMLDFNLVSFYNDDQEYLNAVCLSSYINTSKLNGKECYVIKHFDDETWIDKETGIVIKIKGGTIVKADGTELTTSVEYTDWKINSVTDEEVARPDLVGYTIAK